MLPLINMDSVTLMQPQGYGVAEQRKACKFNLPKPPLVTHGIKNPNLAENLCGELTKEGLPTCSGVTFSRGNYLDHINVGRS